MERKTLRERGRERGRERVRKRGRERESERGREREIARMHVCDSSWKHERRALSLLSFLSFSDHIFSALAPSVCPLNLSLIIPLSLFLSLPTYLEKGETWRLRERKHREQKVFILSILSFSYFLNSLFDFLVLNGSSVLPYMTRPPPGLGTPLGQVTVFRG